jgi:hypothetical protein
MQKINIANFNTKPTRPLLGHNAASMRGFVVEAKPQRKRRRRAWPCYTVLVI